MSVAVIGAGMSGLIAAHASNYKAVVLEADHHLNSSFGDMVGARFVHESPETRELFAYDGPAGTVEVSSDEEDLEAYIRKTRRCDWWDIPESERESVMNWGQGSFPFLPLDVVTWAKKTAERAGVVFDAKVAKVEKDGAETQLIMQNGSLIEYRKVLFTIPLPVMMRIAGVAGSERFNSYPTTVGLFKLSHGHAQGTWMRYITDESTPLTRITVHRNMVIVEASASQSSQVLQLMSAEAEDRLRQLGLPTGPLSASFSTFRHHFAYFPDFLEVRQAAYDELAAVGLFPLGRYAKYSHRIKTRETYLDAQELLR